MKNWGIYRLLLDLVPANSEINASDFSPETTRALKYILKKHRCAGATLCAFNDQGVTGTLSYGLAHRPNVKAQPGTVYRAASISKFVTALGVMKLKEEGKIDLDRDVNDFLPFSLRHPKAPDTPLTLRLLMTHTAGIHDGDAYNGGIAKGMPLSQILSGDSFTDHLPGALWEYSNLGAGIAGVVLECALGVDFETLMQDTVFAPLGVNASYYPQRIRGDLADAWRILPPSGKPNFDAAARKSRPLPAAAPDPETHYALAHGNLCVSAPDLARLGIAAMEPGFLSPESLAEMRRAFVPFGERAGNLSEGLFTFVLEEPRRFPRPLYGHQGMAYGAVHGLFFDPAAKKGVALLTSAASEARRGVMADLNMDILSLLLGGKNG